MSKSLRRLLLPAVIPAIFLSPAFAGGKSIYGTDDRMELFEASPMAARLADSVVSLWSSENIAYEPASEAFSLKTEKLTGKFDLCPGERFREQRRGSGLCSGALVGEDLIMTAGHCITEQTVCDNTKVVFGFALKKPGGGAPASIARKEVYSCKKIIVSHSITDSDEPQDPVHQGRGSSPMFYSDNSDEPQNAVYRGPDYALIRLDRKVTGHKPLAINRTRGLKNGDSLALIGHPLGLPLKIAAVAAVRDVSSPDYFVADLDAFEGNSGSPVFNKKTGLIEGIMVRGDKDLQLTPAGCYTMAVYAPGGGRGEDVSNVDALEPFIPEPADKHGPGPKDGVW
ncbi:MAG: trypsin-like peptidase domain-containing protein [Elusimicrobiales bacterium]|jgi:V8-like Glu-specific endopeptidase